MSLLETTRTEVQRLVTQAKDLRAQLEAKLAGGETLDPTEQEKLENIIGDGFKARKRLESLEQLAALETGTQPTAAQITGGVDNSAQAGGHFRPGAAKTVGARFVDSEAFKRMGADRDNQQASASMNVKSLKAITYGTSGSGGELIRADRQPEIVDIARQRPRSVLDLVNMSETSLTSVDYVRLTGRTNNAAIVAESAAKPEGDLAFDVVTVPVKVIAEWIKATNQILDDAPRLRNIIDNELTYMVEVKFEDIAIADMLAASGIQSRVHQVSGRAFSADDTPADTIRRMLTDIRLEFYEPDGIVLHPTQAEAIELDKGSDGHYTMIYDPVGQRLWRKPIVETPAMTSGTAIAANFRLAYTVWERMAAQIKLGYNNDDFTKNLVTILGEMRAAYGTVRPKALEKATGL
ncbi:MAG TPA: phage major capsid protein [Pyrinomonadaceae bacterium]